MMNEHVYSFVIFPNTSSASTLASAMSPLNNQAMKHLFRSGFLNFNQFEMTVIFEDFW